LVLEISNRLSHLGLDSLHCRRSKADLTLCYKIINNFSYVNITSFPAFSYSNKTRGNSRKLDKSHVLSVRDGHSYAKRIVSVWNSLSDCIVLTRSVIAFKREINKLHFSYYCLT